MRSLAIGFFALSFAAFAQTDRGTITGTVADPANAVIGAMIQAKNQATSFLYQAATSATSNYTIAELPASTYDVTVAAPEFNQCIRPA
jgi:carboxypeptidase family protein